MDNYNARLTLCSTTSIENDASGVQGPHMEGGTGDGRSSGGAGKQVILRAPSVITHLIVTYRGVP